VNPATLHLQNPPKQARSRRTLAVLVAGANALLEREGAEALTVNGVADEAGVSIGSFYGRFEGRDELIHYLGEVALAEGLEGWNAVRTRCRRGGGALPDLHSLARFLVQAHTSGPLVRLRSLKGVLDPAPTRLDRFRSRILGDLEEDLGGSGPAPWVAARVLMGGARALALEDSCQVTPTPELELARAVRAYLHLSERKAAVWAELGEEEDVSAETPDAPTEVWTAPKAPGDVSAETPQPEPAMAAAENPNPDSQMPAPEPDPAPDPPNDNLDSQSAEPSHPDEPDDEEDDDVPVDPFDVWG
jgi:AcrR family transcriptional regulator